MKRDLLLMNFHLSQMKRYPWHIKRALSDMKFNPSQMKFNLSQMKRYLSHIKRDIWHMKGYQRPFKPTKYDITAC